MAEPVTLWQRQSLSSDIGNVKSTFSSWDSCMSAPYCKWPAIIGIIIGSLILLSLLFCLARCLCCGAECCCACFSCCNACCPSPRRRSPKYADPPPPFAPSPYQGYQPTPAPPVYNPQPQYAQFDASRKGQMNEDALPAMPSWDTAASRKVLEDPRNEDVELGRLDPLHEQTAPMLANQAPTPYGDNPGPAAASVSYQQYAPYNGGDLPNRYIGQSVQQHSANPYGNVSTVAAPNYGNPGSGQQGGYSGMRTTRQPQVASTYAPSVTSTRYEPSSSYDGQELGTAYRSRQPAVWQQGLGSPSVAAPVARKPVQDVWRDV